MSTRRLFLGELALGGAGFSPVRRTGSGAASAQEASEFRRPDRKWPSFTTRPVILGRKGVVTSGHYLATAAGFRMLEKGGNAFDAAVAMGFACAVVWAPGERGSHGCGRSNRSTSRRGAEASWSSSHCRLGLAERSCPGRRNGSQERDSSGGRFAAERNRVCLWLVSGERKPELPIWRLPLNHSSPQLFQWVERLAPDDTSLSKGNHHRAQQDIHEKNGAQGEGQRVEG